MNSRPRAPATNDTAFIGCDTIRAGRDGLQVERHEGQKGEEAVQPSPIEGDEPDTDGADRGQERDDQDRLRRWLRW